MSVAPTQISAVQHTREVTRILGLPRRDWTEVSATLVSVELTSLLRHPKGNMALRPVQAQALLDLGMRGGLFGPIGVGEGKTLLSGLAPYVLDARRPLLLLPAKLIEKTKREFRTLALHWPIPNFIRFYSYELLGRVQSQAFLDLYQPDLIMADEAHKLKNRKAACTKRVARYMQAHPLCRFVGVTGTITKRSLKDFAHLMLWALGPQATPLPTSWTELDEWSDALDEKTTTDKRLGTGALSLFVDRTLDYVDANGVQDDSHLNATRRGVRRRMTSTPGVVGTSELSLGCSLTIEALWGDREIHMDPTTDDAFEFLRRFWCAPDGWPLADPMSVWRVARELSLGFFYVWDPRPPDPWANARKCWAAWCRDILTNNRRNLDSELQVSQAVEAGHYPEATPALAEWRRVKKSFEPNSVPVWLDDSVLKACALWALGEPGIIWCEHTAFAERLAKQAKLAYYGRKGQDRLGRPIESHDPKQSLVASFASSAEGRNLQAWNRNLITSWPANGLQCEQVLGRTHRQGQLADEVRCDLVVTSIAHLDAFEQSVRDARRIEATTGQTQRLLYADTLVPQTFEVMNRPGYRWSKKRED